MNKKLAILCIVCLVSLLSGQTFEVLSENASGLTIGFTFEKSNYQCSEQEITIKSYLLSEDDSEAGIPQLPVYSRLVVIPDEVSVTTEVEVLAEDIISDFTGEYEFPDKDACQICERGVIRDQPVVRIMINPFMYSLEQQELRVINKMIIQLRYEHDSAFKIIVPKRESSVFSGILNQSAMNYSDTKLRSDDSRGTYLFIYHAGISNQMIDLLVDWKRRTGYKVFTASTAATGTTAESIKSYILDAYYNWDYPPEFVCLLGDAGGAGAIPAFSADYHEIIYTDYPYSLLSGDDFYADVIVSRLSFSNSTELLTIISKIMVYEAGVPENRDWADHLLLVGDPAESGVAVVDNVNFIENIYLDFNTPGVVHKICEPPFDQQIDSVIMQGVSSFFYRGFAGVSNWTIDGSTNSYPAFPFVSLITCHTNHYADSNSICEQLLSIGTPTSPKGAIAALGSSGLTHTSFNNLMTARIAHHFYVENGTNPAIALNLAKIALFDNYPTNPEDFNRFNACNINMIGDPGLSIRTKKPGVLSAEYDHNLPAGSTFLTVALRDEFNEPVADAYVTLSDSIIQIISRSDMNGQVTLIFPSLESGEYDLTATKQNCLPYLGNVLVAAGENLTIVNINAPDNIFVTEEINFGITLQNVSASQTYNNVSGIITTNSPYVTITEESVDFGSILPGEIVESSEDYTLIVSGDCPDQQKLEFLLTTGDIVNAFDLTVSAPGISLEGTSTDDTPMIPGEVYNLILSVSNTGSMTLPACTVTISSPQLLLSQPEATFHQTEPDATTDNADNPFEFLIPENFFNGMPLQFTAEFSSDNGICRSLPFVLSVGTPETDDPTGPDEYGYWCFDDNDLSYDCCPEYDWIEINPGLGGNGTCLNLNDTNIEGSGDCALINLPFPIRMYGVEYNQITVSSNGFIIPGDFDYSNWMNWSIPGSNIPCPIIAPFWDDLLTTTGNVYYFYDSAHQEVVIEWSQLSNKYDNSPETFQVIISDFRTNHTLLGDSKILFQYQEIHNTDMGSYSNDVFVDHGEYATVGIADYSHENGLQYSYANQYPVSANQLHNEMSLLFTGNPVTPREPVVIIESLNITDSDGDNVPENGDVLEIVPVLRNVGSSATDSCKVIFFTYESLADIENPEYTFEGVAAQNSMTLNNAFQLSVHESFPVSIFNGYLEINYAGHTVIRPVFIEIAEQHSDFNDENIPDKGKFSLSQNYPNPIIFSDNSRKTSTTFRFSLAEDNNLCKMDIYNLKGELIKTLINQPHKAGDYEISWNGKNSNEEKVASGIYFYRLKTDSGEAVKKTIILK